MELLNRGLLKTHEYVSFRFAPSIDNDNSGIDTLIKSFHSLLNHQMFKSVRDGQPVASIELYADGSNAHYLITVPKNYKMMIKEKITSAFPGSGSKEFDVKGWPMDDDKDSLIASLSVNKQPFFPIEMKEGTSICKDYLHLIDDMREKEKLFLQILLEPIENGWQDELEKSYEDYLVGKGSGSAGSILQSSGKKLDGMLSNMARSFTSDDNEPTRNKRHREMKEFQQKVRQSGFRVAVRVMVRADSYERRNDLIEGIAGSFKTSGGHNNWQLNPTILKKSALQSLRTRQMPLLSSTSLLCDDEVKTLLRFPTKEVESLKLARMRPDERKIDVRITKNIIPMGKSIKFGEIGTPVGFSIDNPDTASKARIWIAAPGSGKTKAAQIFKNGAMRAGHGGSLFDVADGKLYYESVSSTPPEYRDKLVLVNFANEQYPHIFNFNSLGRDAETVGTMFTEFFEVFFKTQSNHRMNSFLRKGSMTAFASPDSTFLELIMLLRDEEFRKKFLPKIRKTNPDLFLWWMTEFPKIAKSDAQMSEILQPILYRLDELQYNPRLGPIFCGKGGRLEINRWMNEGKWVLYNLSNGVFLENEQRMMMSFLNYSYWSATLARERMIQNGIEPIVHHKIYDEPQTYMNATPVTKLSISKSRKYRVSDNFFIQSPSQIIEKDPELWAQILDMNPHILIGGSFGKTQLKLISEELNISIEELRQLSQLEYHWYFKTYVGKELIPPFIFDGKMEMENYGEDPMLNLRWRQHFAPYSVDQIKEENTARNLKMTVDEYRELIESYDEQDDEEGVKLG